MRIFVFVLVLRFVVVGLGFLFYIISECRLAR